jgi:myo-inositol-1(or 4)-monophosphatase
LVSVEFSRRELEDLRRMVVRVAGEAAAYLRDRLGVSELLEVVTVHKYDSDEGMRVDVESERNIVDLLRAEGFDGIFVGEETGVNRLGSGRLIAVADPLDGSKNYASLVPWCAVSIAIAAPQSSSMHATLNDVVVGAIAPVFQWPVLSFARGVGAFEGSTRVKASGGSKLVIAYVENLEQAQVVQHYLQLVGGGRGVRALGSASLEVAWTGMGRAEVFIDVRGKLRTVDIAAAFWFAREAGAYIMAENRTARLDKIDRVGSVIAASTPSAWEKLIKALNGTTFERLVASENGHPPSSS